MKKKFFTIKWLGFYLGLSFATMAQAQYHIVPQPNNIKSLPGNLTIGYNSHIALYNDSIKSVAQIARDFLISPTGKLPVFVSNSDAKTADIIYKYQAGLGDGYQLLISGGHLIIKASNRRGFFYAGETLRQILAQSPMITNQIGRQWQLHNLDISDSPRFAYRGFMLDVARHYMSPQNIKKLIDVMAMLKLNVLHLHLTDDNGWRLEIKKYPKLTSVGAWRVDRGNQFVSNRRNQRPGEPTPIGGYYTQSQMKGIVRYAQDRMITIIPEIDMPAHANAALAAYPQYACQNVKGPITVIPGLGGNNYKIIFCAGKDATYTFIENILKEVMQIFPSHYIHIGGDEANKYYWKTCPDCQARMKKEHLKNVDALQGYFIKRITDFLHRHGREAIGWDELTSSPLPSGIRIFGWRGDGRAALIAAKQNHYFVMTPAKTLYLIRYQGPQWFEPMTYFGNNTLKDVFSYNPVKKEWPDSYKKLLWGVQASMWTEFCNTDQAVFYMVFPRLIALSEIAWTQPEKKNWDNFLIGMDDFLLFLENKGITYARSMYNIQHIARPVDGKVSVTLQCIRPDVQIHYTLDGSLPTLQSPLYTQPIIVSKSTMINAVTYKDGKPIGEILQLPIRFNLATGHKILGYNGRGDLLTNGVNGSCRQGDFEWFYPPTKKPSEIILDLAKKQSIHKVSIGALTNYGMAIQPPRKVELWVSDDNKIYHKVADRTFNNTYIFQDIDKTRPIIFEFSPTQARYIKIISTDAGFTPDNHVRPDQPTRYCYDEIVVQ